MTSLVVFVVAGILRMNKEWLVLVTAGLHQIDCGTSMVAWRILFNDGDGDVVVTPHLLHSTPLTTTSHPHHEYRVEWNEINVE
mmetsp:Transcript_11652/g.12735  ORF Transcript_11652/g.12735 Transcript_11652/m.12735 type:complete len:83 (-) Transcript_11652:595-843(-)